MNKIEALELQTFWDLFFTSEDYRNSLKTRILKGKAPHMEVLLHHMVYGKPKETLALTGEGDGLMILVIGDKAVKAQVLEDGKVRIVSDITAEARELERKALASVDAAQGLIDDLDPPRAAHVA